MVGFNRVCTCPPGYTGNTCETPVCIDGVSCLNGGTCAVVNNTINCTCASGYSGPSCSQDIDVCPSTPCQNGGTCSEGPGLNYTCSCPDRYGGVSCQTPLPCTPNPCQNGGQCVPGNGISYTCNCPENFSGTNCDTMLNATCAQDSDCPNSSYCHYQCRSDYYPSHSSLLTESIDLRGVSFVNVEESKFPSFSGDFSLYAVFSQNTSNRGYLVFYGTSSVSRNFAVFLDHNNSKLWFYYTDTAGVSQNFSLSFTWSSNAVHQLVITYNRASRIANFFFDGSMIANGVKTLTNPDFSYGVSDAL